MTLRLNQFILVITSFIIIWSCNTKKNSSGSSTPAAEIDALIKQMNDSIFRIGEKQGGTGVDSALKEFETLYKQQADKSSVGIYYAVSQILDPLESIIWLSGDLARESDTLYTSLAGWVRGINYRRDYYGDHIYQILVYLTRPHPTKDRFKTIGEAQQFALANILPKIDLAISTLSKARDQNPQFLLDMNLFSGITIGGEKVSLISERNARKTILPYHVDWLISFAERVKAGILSHSAYDMDLYPYFLNQLVSESFKNGIKKQMANNLKKQLFSRDSEDESDRLKLLNTADYARILREPAYKNMFTLRDFSFEQEGKQVSFSGKQLLKDAHQALIRSAEAELKSHIGYVAHGKDLDRVGSGKYERARKFLWNPLSILLDNEDWEKALNDRIKILKGKTQHTSFVSGRSFAIDASAFFEGISDLKELFPVKFEEENNDNDYEKVNGKLVLIYRKGNPVEWKDTTFAGLFPEVTSSEQLKSTLREASLDFSTQFFVQAVPAPVIYANAL